MQASDSSTKTPVETDEELVSVPRSEWEQMSKTTKRQGKVAYLLLVVSSLLFVAVLFILMNDGDQTGRLKTGRDQRVGYQSEQMFIQCQLAEDDVRELPDGQATDVRMICDRYGTPEEARETERDR